MNLPAPQRHTRAEFKEGGHGDEITYRAFAGAAIRDQLSALAALRLEVFHDWPYLYEGTLDYERRYCETYARCAQGLAVLAFDGRQCVGATTALPMAAAPDDMQHPFRQQGLPLETILYLGESVVLPSHRGRGIGVRFFELRESHARSLGLTQCAFCAVDRPATHALKPADYLPNDAFWMRRGYTREPSLRCHFDWQDRGESTPTVHTLTYWLRTL